MISEYEDFIKGWANFICVDCNMDTSPLGLDEYYMVNDEVWAESGMDALGGMLCLLCLEARIGRDLEVSDLTDAPINNNPYLLEYING